MRIGIMGGTFDPIHIGHLAAAEHAREALDLERVWFMPSYAPPHKPNAPLASPAQRLRMVELAIAGNPAFEAADVELRSEGTSYSVDTMEKLTAEFPNEQFYYIIGGDMVDYLPQWHRIDDLIRLVTFVGMERPGTAIRWDQLSDQIKSRLVMIPMKLLDISSSHIRQRVLEGKSVRYMLPDPVWQYVKECNLYESNS